MSILDKLRVIKENNQIIETEKENIRLSIESKGVDIPYDTTLGEYSNKIYSIQTGVTNSEIETILDTIEDGLEDAEERITSLEGLQETQHVWQAPDWSSLFARNGYFVIADDALGENRPDGLPVPESNEVIYYNVISVGKNSIEGHNKPTLILQRQETLDVYFVSMADGNIVTATRLVNRAELDDAIAGMATDIGNMTAEIGSIDTILDILNGDLEADIQEILGNIEGV